MTWLALWLMLLPTVGQGVPDNPQGACCFCQKYDSCRVLPDELCDGLGGIWMGQGSCVPDRCGVVCGD